MSDPISPMRIGNSYTVSRAARLAGTTPQNVRRWLYGYEAPGHKMKPVFGPQPDGPPAISFLQLAELIVVARYRQRSGAGRGHVFGFLARATLHEFFAITERGLEARVRFLRLDAHGLLHRAARIWMRVKLNWGCTFGLAGVGVLLEVAG